MDDQRYKNLHESFASKPSSELRRLLAERDSSVWSEEAIAAAADVLASRPTEKDKEGTPSNEAALPLHGGVFELSAEKISGYRLKIKVLGWVFCFIGLMLLMTMLSFVQEDLHSGAGSLSIASMLFASMIMLIGYGLIKLDARARWPGVIMSVLLLFFMGPIGAVIGLFGLLWIGKRGGVLAKQTDIG